MQAYNAAFARVYNRYVGEFARDAAPRLFDFYTRTGIAPENPSLLDVCCGTGQLALHFLERGFRVTGIDLSEPMLDHARENTRMFVQAGQARFVQANASQFTLDERFGLATSTFDALNHLLDEAALRGCFASVRASMVEGGTFIFDLNTRLGLQRWNNINVTDTAELMLVTRGTYDGGDRAYMRISGFIRDDDGRYSRFEEQAYNTVFDLGRVRDLLLETGWRDPYFARLNDLSAPLDEPEREGRVFVVATH
jgi:SAM-dependent methyltransferase